MELNIYLEDLAKRIDKKKEQALMNDWKKFNKGRYTGKIFRPERGYNSHPEVDWPEINVNQALNDYDKMALQQYNSCSNLLEEGKGEIMAVRCNYGTSIIPSLFGVELFIMDKETNTLPTSRPLKGGKEDVKKIINQGVPDINKALGKKVLEMGKHFVKLQKQYPEIEEHVHIYHPDLQGPMDICEVLWGSDLFLDIMDEPELVHDFLNLITETYIKFMEKWREIVPFKDEFAVHWGLVHRGNIMLRDDSAMNFSPEMFAEFIKPYDQKLLNIFGGGALHFCGKGDHYISSAASIDNLYAVNMSQPDYNDMEIIYQNTVDKDIKLIGFSREYAQRALERGRKLKGQIQC